MFRTSKCSSSGRLGCSKHVEDIKLKTYNQIKTLM